MAQGHIIPFLSLGLKLEQEKGYSITFVNTPLNITKLQNHLPKSSNIRLLEIPFDSTEHGLPPNSENTETLPPPLMLQLVESSPALKPAFRQLMSCLYVQGNTEKRPLCVISDMFFAWSADVAHEFGIPHAIFNAGGGYGIAGWHTSWLNIPQLKSNSGEFWLPGFPKGYSFKTKNLPEHLQVVVKGPWEFALEMFEDWKKTDAMLFNTIEDVDGTGLTYFREQFPCSVYAVGPIISSAGSKARGGEEAEVTRNICIKWLNSKPKNSVLYVAFGSQSSTSEAQTRELAKALEASNVNFIWVVRPPSNSLGNNTNTNWFPIGFEERIASSKKGLLLKKWAPQAEILSHDSIGAFFSHCGWNSIIEGLSNGVPMLSWPMGAEQPFNAQLLEDEMRVCIGVANGASCEVKYEEIIKKIELMMRSEEGNVMRRKAVKVMEIIKNATTDEWGYKGSSVKAMDDFLNLILLRNKLYPAVQYSNV
ncbi:hypothetical protein ACJIZ3_011968 [Penstemon smallii]|uniref:Glycosyltransferase n=1 Tax=Penstemon smallii TaxID=265156 RepID=A0ABD3UKM4_9LAMI